MKEKWWLDIEIVIALLFYAPICLGIAMVAFMNTVH